MENVLGYFGLAEDPFSISPNPRYLYLTPQHTTAVAQARYVIENRQGLGVIRGDIGTGKSTVARHIYQQYQDNPTYKLAMTVTPDLKTETAFLRSVLSEYGVMPKRSYAASMSAFRNFAGKSYSEGKNLVLLIDEAQDMTPEMLKVVKSFHNFETNEEKFIQVILFGQEELGELLSKNALRAVKSRVSVFGQLSALTDSDINDMIGFRWHAAGGKGQHPFPLETVHEIAHLAHGLPRDVVKLCSYSLIRAMINDSKTVHTTMVRAVLKEAFDEEGDK